MGNALRVLWVVWSGVLSLAAWGWATSLVAPASGPVAPIRQSVEVSGVKVSYLEGGPKSGPAVLLVHGLGSSAELNWVRPGTFGMLAEKCHVIAVDLRGHGESDKPKSDADYGRKMSEDLVAVLDQAGAKRAHLVGYSLGGVVVMRFAVDHPDRVQSIALGGMGWLKTGSFLAKSWGHLAREGGTFPAAAARTAGDCAISEDELRAIRAPGECLSGDRDPTRKLYVEPLLAVRPDWKMVSISGAGHLSCIAKEDFKNGLVEWVGKN
jgi:pimeloyl-ACP methyl ester carboxylesterase